MVQDDWQWPSMRNNSPDALYCPIIASNFAIGPPPPYGTDDPSARADEVHSNVAMQPSRDRRPRCNAIVAIEIFDMRIAPHVGVIRGLDPRIHHCLQESAE